MAPIRKCIGCGKMREKSDMIRIIRTRDGEVCADYGGKENTRGAYLCRDAECLRMMIKRKGLERSFKRAVSKENAVRIEETLQALIDGI